MGPVVHDEAAAWLTPRLAGRTGRTVDFGSLAGDGLAAHLRTLLCGVIVGVDRQPGPGVDVVCDIADFHGAGFDLCLCTEVLEHAPDPAAVLAAAFRVLKVGGTLLLTAAGPGREPHTGVYGAPGLLPGEHYANIDPAWLIDALAEAGFRKVHVEVHDGHHDVYAQAVR